MDRFLHGLVGTMTKWSEVVAEPAVSRWFADVIRRKWRLRPDLCVSAAVLFSCEAFQR